MTTYAANLTYVAENIKPSAMVERYPHDPECLASSLVDYLNEQSTHGLSLVECKGETIYIFRRVEQAHPRSAPAPSSKPQVAAPMASAELDALDAKLDEDEGETPPRGSLMPRTPAKDHSKKK